MNQSLQVFQKAIDLIDTSENKQYAEFLAKNIAENKLANGLKNAFSGVMNIFSKMGTEINKGLNISDSDKNNLVDLFKRVESGDRRYMSQVITMAQFLATQPEKRRDLQAYLELQNKGKANIPVALDSFYSIKEFMTAILYSCFKAGDEYSALNIIRLTQYYTVKFQKNDQHVTRRMGSFYYSHPIVRKVEFWVKALVDLYEVRSN